MSTIHAVFSNGVFKPREQVDLPENAEVEFEPRVVEHRDGDDSQGGIHGVLGRRFRSGHHDTAERHDEHQP